MLFHPEDVADYMLKNGVSRGYVILQGGELVPSHPCLSPLALFLRNDALDFANHEGESFHCGHGRAVHKCERVPRVVAARSRLCLWCQTAYYCTALFSVVASGVNLFLILRAGRDCFRV
jgi:hypothetical protein